MMQKRNRMIMFAVLAVIIVAVPVSFYELSYPPNSTITSVHNGVANGIFYLNLSQNSPHGIFYPGISSNSTFTSSASLNSSLSMSLENSSVFYNTCGGFYQLCVNNFNISGAINGNIRPTNITVTQIEGAQYPYAMKFMLIPGDERAINTSKISCLFFTDWNNNYENSTDIYGGVFSNVTLLNDSAGQHTLFSAQKLPKSITYTFKLSNRFELELYPTYHSYNVTSYFLSLIVSLNGLGKTIQTQINIEIIRGSGS